MHDHDDTVEFPSRLAETHEPILVEMPLDTAAAWQRGDPIDPASVTVHTRASLAAEKAAALDRLAEVEAEKAALEWKYRGELPAELRDDLHDREDDDDDEG